MDTAGSTAGSRRPARPRSAERAASRTENGRIGAAPRTFTLLATFVVEGGLPTRLRKRRLTRMLDSIEDHFIVVAIQRPDGHLNFNPEPDTAIRAGDELVVLGRPHSLKRLEAEAAS